MLASVNLKEKLMTKQLFVYRPVVKNVDRYTRAGMDGRDICCPNCDHWKTVYHFSWSSLTCQLCELPINKSVWWTPE